MTVSLKNLNCWLLIFMLILLPTHSAFSAINIINHNTDGALVDGLNRLLGGTDFLLPPAQQGGQYLIVNESGQAVNIIPGAEGLALGSLPAGHQGVLESGGQLEVIDIGQNRYHLWQGGISDGGDYYVVVNPVPELSIVPSAVNFSTVTVGSFQDLVLTVSNVGTADLGLGDVALLNPLEVPFELVAGQDQCSGQSLAPAASCVFTVRFSPLAAGAFNDAFDLPSNDPAQSSALINVGGTGATVAINFAQTDFSGAATGSGLPADWTERWLTNDPTISYEVVDSAIFPGTKDLKATIYDNSSEKRFIATFDGADSLGPDVDLLMLFSDPVNEGSEHTDFRLFARAGGDSGSENGYFFTTKNNQRLVRIYKYVNGVLTELAGGNDESIPFNSSEPWWVRFRVEGASVQARLWPYGSVEPGDWQLSAVDSDIVAGGWQGIGSLWRGEHIFHEFTAAQLPDEASPVNGFGIMEIIPLAMNLDAETGNVTGWTDEFGQLQVTSSFQRTGGYAFQGGPSDYRAFQRIDLSQSGVTAQHLLQGAKFSFRGWQRSYGWNNDPGRLGLRFLDANQVEISATFTAWDFLNYSYSPKGLIETIPADAAYVDIILEGQYVAGAGTGAYFDDLSVAIGISQ